MSYRQIMQEYGVTAVVVHTSMWLATLGATYVAILNGVDVKALIQRFDSIPYVDSSKINPEAGTLVAAYLVTSLSGPVRGGLTLMATPAVSKALVRIFPAYGRISLRSMGKGGPAKPAGHGQPRRGGERPNKSESEL